MNYKPFTLRSSSTIKTIKQKIELAWQAVFNKWELSKNNNNIVFDVCEAYKKSTILSSGVYGQWSIVYGEDKNNWVAINNDNIVLDSLNKLLFNEEFDTFNNTKSNSKLLNYVSKKFIEELSETIFNNIDNTDASTTYSDDWVNNPDFRKGCGILKADIRLGDITLNVLISNKLISDSEIKIKPKEVELTGYKEAIGERTILLSAMLDNIKINFKQLNDLEEGDVIKLKKNINDPIIVSNNDRKIFSGYLCQNNNNKTIQLTSR